MNDKKMNVLFIAVDDLRDFAACMSAYPGIKTPNIDRLAKRGVVFTNAHCQAAMCAPSRTSLLTGIRPSTSGAYGFQPWMSIPMLRDADNIPRHFMNNGYYVMGTGKIHHGSVNKSRFEGPYGPDWDDYWPSIETPYLTDNGDTPNKSKGIGNLIFGPGDLPEEECAEYKHANWAIEQLNKEYDRPFFLGLGFHKPHLPFICPRKYFDMYDENSIQPVFVKEDDLDDIPDAGKYLVKIKLDKYIREHKLQKEILHAYMACVSFMDAQLGRVLDALERSPYADNTVIVLFGDNGWHFGEKHTWKKFTLWREATRVPLIISCPGKQQNVFCNKPVELIDIFPTLIELCSLSRTRQEQEGASLVPLLDNPEAEWNKAAITTHGRDSHCITTEGWKYIRYFDGSEELYNRLSDVFEWNNLADNDNYRHVKETLKKYIPAYSAPNAPLTTLKEYFSTDYPDLETWRKKNKDLF